MICVVSMLYVLITSISCRLRQFLSFGPSNSVLYFRGSVLGSLSDIDDLATTFSKITITGQSFCKSSEIATDLINSNILRIGKVNVTGDVILFLGKMCVSLASALFAFLMLDTYKYNVGHNKISSPVFPRLGFLFGSNLFQVSVSEQIMNLSRVANVHNFGILTNLQSIS